MYYLLVLAGAVLAVELILLEKIGSKRRAFSANKNSDLLVADEAETSKRKRVEKPFKDKFIAPSVLLGLLYAVRYLSGDRTLGNATMADISRFDPYGISGLVASPLPDWLTAMAGIFMWLEAAAVLIVILYPLFDFKNINNLVKFFATPVFIFELTLMYAEMQLFCSFGMDVGTLYLSAASFAGEIGMSFAICGYAWIRDPRFKISKAEVKNLLLSILPVLIAAFPPYLLQLLFGKANALYEIKGLTPQHRAFLYAAVVVPIVTYFGLRNKSKDVIRFSLLFLSLATMVSYTFNYTFIDIIQPWHWPLHLCNTAMYIVPICLIFKWDKLFYFTYFINVMGAFIAMAMPNYDDGTNIISTKLILFWINHFCAFFMPLLLVALKVFDRPHFKQFRYSMIGFLIYFVLMLIVNGWFSNYVEGGVDYFFLNKDFVVSKLGSWAEKLRENYVWQFDIGNLHFVYYPVYQTLFFIVYVGIAFGMWFIYEQFFAIADFHYDMMIRNRKFRQDKYAMKSALNGRKKSEPMYDQTDKLILEGFGKRYGTSNVYAVKNADLEVNAGEIFGFLGPNGAGKSTIIKSIVGIQPITEGTIKVCGYDVEKQSVEAKRQIGYVPDHYALYERLTGREYINYIADIYDVSKEDRDERIEKYVELFELQGAIDNSMRTYSHGMKQKITIMAALIHDPKLWILDEPLTGLDPNSIYQVKECMKQHAKAGNIVFFSSHIIDVVERICDRITIIKKGKIICTRNVSDFGPDNTLEDFYLKTIEETEVEREEIDANVQPETKRKHRLFKRD